MNFAALTLAAQAFALAFIQPLAAAAETGAAMATYADEVNAGANAVFLLASCSPSERESVIASGIYSVLLSKYGEAFRNDVSRQTNSFVKTLTENGNPTLNVAAYCVELRERLK